MKKLRVTAKVTAHTIGKHSARVSSTVVCNGKRRTSSKVVRVR